MKNNSILSVNGLYTHYLGGLKLENISIDIQLGEMVSILGANGAGKTSLLGTIAGLFPVKKGRVTFNGKNITNTSAHIINKLGIGLAPQNHPIFENMRVDECLSIGRSDIDNNIFSLFPNLKAKRNIIAGKLSGGERQMLSMAMVLVNNPKICLLDEPSSGLAPVIVKQVFEAIKIMTEKGMTILMVEQNANIALKISDRAYVMEHGRIIMEGTAQVLSESERVRRAYLGL